MNHNEPHFGEGVLILIALCLAASLGLALLKVTGVIS